LEVSTKVKLIDHIRVLVANLKYKSCRDGNVRYDNSELDYVTSNYSSPRLTTVGLLFVYLGGYMPFVSKENNGGEIDPKINTKGRIDQLAPAKKPTNRQLREREMLSLLRKLKPLVADSINTAAKIMKSEQAADVNKLKAATILLENYKEMVEELYDKDYDDEGAEEIQQPNAPIFSLKVVNNE
jgi:hypothetical protein